MLRAAIALHMVAAMFACAAAAADPLNGASLDEDVKRYDSFGPHRYGSPGATRALDWIAEELAQAGLAVSSQAFTIGRQYDFESGALRVSGRTLSVVPHWWIPEQAASFRLNAPIATGGDAGGRFVRISLPFDRAAYLTQAHRTALDEAFARRPAAVLLTIEHPSGEIYTYNVDQESKPWPVPVILVAPRDKPVLDAAEQAGQAVEVEITGRYRHEVAGHNVVGRLDRGTGRAIVISTPVTSWFTSTCERGPGIAGFLAMARLAKTRLGSTDLVFVATAGHEIGHGGMDDFIRKLAPAPSQTLAWAHFGASLACYDWRLDGGRWVAGSALDARLRVIARSQSMDEMVRRHFAAIAGTALVGDKAAVGELRDVHAAGYPNFFGMAGLHGLFHTPVDNAAGTGPDILVPVAEAFAAALEQIAAISAR
ncbi:MAG TPA: hypothetical protein VE963_12220 [Reyranella sp.]|nr:hypothetical protein [Reyranella sp.]